MSSKRKEIFEFGEFRLDVDEHTIERLDGARNGTLTEKAFQALVLLVQRRGHLVSKDELINFVWPDTIVEDNNLEKCIHQIRHFLGETSNGSKYIETVRKHGYRFVEQVESVDVSSSWLPETFRTDGGEIGSSGTNDHHLIQPEPESESTVGSGRVSVEKRAFIVPVVVFAFLLAGGLVVWSWYESNRDINANVPIMRTPFASELLSTNGKVAHAVISADGRNVFFTNGMAGRQSIWLRQLEDSTNVEIIPPSDDQYGGLALSPDGKFLYFTRGPRNSRLDVYRISTFGGVPVKILSEAQGSISISPDGSKISFIRGGYGSGSPSLWIADAADGRNERSLVARDRPNRIGPHKISPDGMSIAFAAGHSENAANEFGLFIVNIDTGVEREITTQKFFNIKGLQWLPDQSRLLLTATRIPVKNFRIWEVSAESGEIRDLTNSSESYSGMSLSKASDMLVSTLVKQDFHLSVFRVEDPVSPRVLVDANTASYTPDGKILFSSSLTGNHEVWRIQSDESGQIQLTNSAADDSSPVASADNNSIFFVSNRSGSAHVWRMGVDGSNQVQITHDQGGYPLFVSPDGEWVYYHHGTKRTLWRVSFKSGEEEQVLGMERPYFALSPDGSLLAFSNLHAGRSSISIYSLTDRQVVRNIAFEESDARPTHLAWQFDGKTVAFITEASYLRNSSLWLQPIDGGERRQLADLGEGEVNAFSMAPDGKSFAVVQGSWKHDAVLLRGLQ